MSYRGWESYVPPGKIGDDGKVQLAKPSKYRNRKTTVDGITFDSAKEARRWTELLLLQRTGHVHGVQRQKSWDLHIHCEATNQPVFVGKFTPDFQYWLGDRFTVEDVKSPASRTGEAYRLRKRMFEAEYGITVLET